MARHVRGAFAVYQLGAEPIFEGGSARLFRVKGSPPVLYKELKTPLRDGHIKRVAELVEVGREIKGRSELRADVHRIAWPLDLVVDRGALLGVVMPRAGEEYFRRLKKPLLTQNFGHLAGADAPPAKERLSIVRQLAGALAVLERQHLVHGDISATNLVWTLKPAPSLLLIDCDGIHPRGFRAVPAFTKHWMDPRLELKLIPRHDTQSDWYALALAVYRLIVLNFRAVPDSRYFDSMADELPTPIADALISVFQDTSDGAARVLPSDWKQILGSALDDEEQCRQIDAITSDRPSSVAGRRSAGGQWPGAGQVSPQATQNRPEWVPLSILQPKLQQADSKTRVYPGGAGIPAASAPASTKPAPKPPAKPPRARPRPFRRFLLLSTLLLVGIFTLYHYTGLPNWPILNTLNPFLTASQRKLVAEQPAAVRHCREQPLHVPSGALAVVRCGWNGRDFIALAFSSVRSRDAFYRHRLALARRSMAGARLPAPCPRIGRWPARNHHHSLGYVIPFSYADGARLDWFSSTQLTYRIGLGPSGSLKDLCSWWTHLEQA
jgi:hypothetical protein